jgi:hypothetical protein
MIKASIIHWEELTKRRMFYLRTTPVTPQAKGDPIELKNLARRAAEQLQAAGTDKRSCVAIAEQLDDLVDDHEFWRFQAHSLAIPSESADVSLAQCASAARDRLRPLSCVANQKIFT